MIDHTGIGVADVGRSATFYDAALGALGMRRVMQMPDNGRIYRLGVITGAARLAPWNVAFFEELKGLGFVEGQNLKFVAEGFGLRDDQFAKVAATLAKSARTLSFASAILRSAQRRNRPGPFPLSAWPASGSLRVLCARSPAPVATSPASTLRSKSMENGRTSSWRLCPTRGVSHSLWTQASPRRRTFRHFRTPLVRVVSRLRSLQPERRSRSRQ